MAIIGALAKGLVKGGGRAVASNIMGRKKTVKPSAIAPRQGAQGQQQGQRKGSALVKSPTTAITKAMTVAKATAMTRTIKIAITAITISIKQWQQLQS